MTRYFHQHIGGSNIANRQGLVAFGAIGYPFEPIIIFIMLFRTRLSGVFG